MNSSLFTFSRSETAQLHARVESGGHRVGASIPLAAHLFDGGDDAVISAAAADVAAHAFAHGHAFRAAFLQESGGGHDLARRAVAALESVVLDEGLLQRVER